MISLPMQRAISLLKELITTKKQTHGELATEVIRVRCTSHDMGLAFSMSTTSTMHNG